MSCFDPGADTSRHVKLNSLWVRQPISLEVEDEVFRGGREGRRRALDRATDMLISG